MNWRVRCDLFVLVWGVIASLGSGVFLTWLGSRVLDRIAFLLVTLGVVSAVLGTVSFVDWFLNKYGHLYEK